MFQDTEATKQMRIDIANDVLDMLDMRLIQVKVDNSYLNIDAPKFSAKNICDLLPKLRPDQNVCTVCAIGVAILSAARMGSIGACQVKFSSGGTWAGFNDILTTLVIFFSREQLAAIETAFEGHSFIPVDGNNLAQENRSLWQDAIRFREPYLTGDPIDADALLREIWTNIADNDGTFVP